MSFRPVDIGKSGAAAEHRDFGSSGLREGVGALPPGVASLALLPELRAEREGGGASGAWHLQKLPYLMNVASLQELCAVFDQPGLPCGLEGMVGLALTPPAGADPEALGAYLGQCSEVAGQLRVGRTGGVELTLEVESRSREVGGDGDGGGGFLDRVLGAVLPAAASHVCWLLLLLLDSGCFPPFSSRHFVAPGLAFPLLEQLVLYGSAMEAEDVADLAWLAAPRLCRIGLLYPATDQGGVGCSAGTILGGGRGGAAGPHARRAVAELAMGLPRPVDAAGRPADLQIFMGWGANPSTQPQQQEVNRALAAAGRGWARIH